MGVEAEAKVSGMCNRASEESKTRSRRRGHQTVTKNHPNSRKWWRINRHRKRMMKHEGQPRQPSQPTNSGDTSARSTPTLRERKGSRGTPSANPADNTATGAPWHRVQRPPNPASKRSRISPANHPQGKQRTLQALRKRTQPDPSKPTRGVDQQAGDRHANPHGKGAEPRRGSSGRGSCIGTKKKKQGGNRTTVTRQPPNPCETITAGVEQPTRVSQQGNCRRAASCMTRRGKTAGVPRQAEQTHQGGSARAYVTPSRRRKKKTAPLLQKEKSPNTKTGTTREGGLQLKPPRLVTLGERERGE